MSIIRAPTIVCDVCTKQRTMPDSNNDSILPEGWITVNDAEKWYNFCSRPCARTFLQPTNNREYERNRSG